MESTKRRSRANPQVSAARELIYNSPASAPTSAAEEQNEAYAKILDDARSELRDNHAEIFASTATDKDARVRVMQILLNLISEKNWRIESCASPEILASRIYEDMAGFGCITEYLYDPQIEEIDCNRWDDIELLGARGWQKAPVHFASAEQCADIARKMVRLGGVVLDGQTPVADSYITAGTRVSAAIPPVAPEDAGAFFSIRKQGKTDITRSELISTGTATDDELDFLLLCLRCGISVGVAGATGAGKTTDVGFLIRTLATKRRIILVEDSRELTALYADADGNVTSRIVSMRTRLGGDFDVTRADLLKLSLRFSPDIIVPAEIRGEEAREAVEAARTGHTTLTTLHAENALDAYTRILTMYSQADANLGEGLLMQNIVKAFPIMVFKRRLPDGSRKYAQIVEAIGYNSLGGIECNTLYEFAIEDNVYNEDGTVTVKGAHRARSKISNELADRMLAHGGTVAEIRKYAAPGWHKPIKPKEAI